jgi:hypothetical protein
LRLVQGYFRAASHATQASFTLAAHNQMPARGGTKPNTASIYGNCPMPVAAKLRQPNGNHRLFNRALSRVNGKQQKEIREKRRMNRSRRSG